MRLTYDFPYPILKNDDSSSYRPDCNFEILDISEAEFKDNRFEIELQISLQSLTLNKYLNDNVCNVYIGYVTDTTRRLVKVNNINDSFSLKIPVSSLKSVDTINVYSYIIAEENFKMDFTNEMAPDYDIGNPMFITKKDILAISNTLEFLYNRTGETIIQFTEVKEDDFKDFKVDLSGENYINIQISHAINEGY